MRKKTIVLFILLSLISSVFLPIAVKGYYTRVINFGVDKVTYFLDDVMNVNTSWELQYNPNTEVAFVQVQIFNESNDLVWSSIEYDTIGTFIEELYINFQQFNLQFTNQSAILYIKFYSYYFHIDSTNTISTFIDTIEVNVTQKDISCEIMGLEDQIIYGTTVSFTASFLDAYDKSSLNNETVLFYVMDSSYTSLFHSEYTSTNSYGISEISFSTSDYIGLGFYVFSLSLENNIYVSKVFSRLIEVIQKNITFEITGLEKQIFYGDSVNLSARFLDTSTNLYIKNESVIFQVFYNNILYYSDNFIINSIGTIDISINSSDYMNIGINTFEFFLDNSIYNNSKFEKEVEVLQKNVVCEIIGLEKQILLGDIVNFTARFLDAHDNSSLKAQRIRFYVVFNSTLYYADNFTTNSLGIIDISINSSDYMNLGKNTFEFFLSENHIYKDARFSNIITVNAPNEEVKESLFKGNFVPFLVFSLMIITVFLIIFRKKIANGKSAPNVASALHRGGLRVNNGVRNIANNRRANNQIKNRRNNNNRRGSKT